MNVNQSSEPNLELFLNENIKGFIMLRCQTNLKQDNPILNYFFVLFVCLLVLAVCQNSSTCSVYIHMYQIKCKMFLS